MSHDFDLIPAATTVTGSLGSNANIIDPACYVVVLDSDTGAIKRHGFGFNRTTFSKNEASAARLWEDSGEPAPVALHLGVHGLHYATSAFGGIRATWCGEHTSKQLGIILLHRHVDRFLDHAVAMRLLPRKHQIGHDWLCQRIVEIANLNHQPGREMYIRPIILNADARLGVSSCGEVVLAIITRECTQYIVGDKRTLWYPGRHAHRPVLRPGEKQLKEAAEYAGSFGFKRTAGELDDTIVEVLRGRETTGSCLVWVDFCEEVCTTKPGAGTLDSITHRLVIDLLRHRGIEPDFSLSGINYKPGQFARLLQQQTYSIALVGTWTGAVLVTHCVQGDPTRRFGTTLQEVASWNQPNSRPENDGKHHKLLQMQRDLSAAIHGQPVVNAAGESWQPPAEWGPLHTLVCAY